MTLDVISILNSVDVVLFVVVVIVWRHVFSVTGLVVLELSL